MTVTQAHTFRPQYVVAVGFAALLCLSLLVVRFRSRATRLANGVYGHLPGNWRYSERYVLVIGFCCAAVAGAGLVLTVVWSIGSQVRSGPGAVAVGPATWVGKALAVSLGLGLIGVGATLMLVGGGVTSRMNSLYAALPEKFQFPPWWHRLIGGIICCFGLIVAVVGGVLAR